MDDRGQKRGKTITRLELAIAIGCSRQNIGMILTNSQGKDQKLSTESHAKAAAFLKVSSEWLLSETGPMLMPENKQNQPLALVDTSVAATNTVASMTEITAALSAKFEEMDASTRKLAVALIGQLADNPQDHARIAAMIDLSIVSKSSKVA